MDSHQVHLCACGTGGGAGVVDCAKLWLCGLCCAPCLYAKVAAAAGIEAGSDGFVAPLGSFECDWERCAICSALYSAWPLGPVYSAHTRARVMQKPPGVEEFATHACCLPCALCQEYRIIHQKARLSASDAAVVPPPDVPQMSRDGAGGTVDASAVDVGIAGAQ